MARTRDRGERAELETDARGGPRPCTRGRRCRATQALFARRQVGGGIAEAAAELGRRAPLCRRSNEGGPVVGGGGEVARDQGGADARARDAFAGVLHRRDFVRVEAEFASKAMSPARLWRSGSRGRPRLPAPQTVAQDARGEVAASIDARAVLKRSRPTRSTPRWPRPSNWRAEQQARRFLRTAKNPRQRLEAQRDGSSERARARATACSTSARARDAGRRKHDAHDAAARAEQIALDVNGTKGHR